MWPRISMAGLTAGILLLLCIVSSVNSFSKYGRGCSDIGCLPNEECVITSDSCSFTQREGKDCGNYPKCQRKSGSSSASSAPVNPSEHTPSPLSVQSPDTRSANESVNLRLKRQSGYGGSGQGMGGQGMGGQVAGRGLPGGMNGPGQMGGQEGMGRGSMNGRGGMGAMGGMGGMGSGREPMGRQGRMGMQGGMGIGMGRGSMNRQGVMGGMGGMESRRGPMDGQGGVTMGGQRSMGGIGGRRGAMGGQGGTGMKGGQRGPDINGQRANVMPRYGGGNMSPYNNNGYGYGNQNGPRGYQDGTSVQSMSSAGEGSFGNRRFSYGQTMGSVNGRPMYGQSYYNVNGRTYGYGGNGLTLTALPNGTFLDGYGVLYQPQIPENLNAPTESTDTTSTTRFSWF